jgi:hypothetical protein
LSNPYYYPHEVEIIAPRGGWMIDDLLEKRTEALIFYPE